MRKLFLISLVLTAFAYANAQKLPKVQTTGIRAPVNVKIDGKTNEWNDQFKAYNNSLLAYYTIANDDDNLYLIMHCSIKTIIDKIALGGIVFTINPINKKETGGVKVTFPVVETMTLDPQASKAMAKINSEKDNAIAQKMLDSLKSATRKTQFEKFKYIAIKGIKQIEDPLIPIYNITGVAIGYSTINGNYSYELAIPLKYLNIKNNTFFYNLKMPGSAVNKVIPPVRLNGTDVPPLNKEDIDIRTLAAITDFWGEYTLAK